MMQRGVTLLELVVALLISSILGLLLLQVLNQTSGSLTTIESIAVADMSVTSFYDRFERDITGIFIPAIGDPALADKVFATQMRQSQEQEQKQQEQKEKVFAAKEKTKPASLQDIQVKKVFVYEEKDKNLSTFSFITANPLAVYREAKPRIVRVIYTLKREEKEATYALWRKESLKLGFKADKEAREYPLLRHIISLRLELLAPQPAAEKPADEKQAKEKTPPLIVYKTWPVATDTEGKKTGKDLPQFVRIFLRYIDPIDKRIKVYEFLFPIMCFRAPSQSILNVGLIHLQREEQKKQLAEQQMQQAKQTEAAAQKLPVSGKNNPRSKSFAQFFLGSQNQQQRRNMVGS